MYLAKKRHKFTTNSTSKTIIHLDRLSKYLQKYSVDLSFGEGWWEWKPGLIGANCLRIGMLTQMTSLPPTINAQLQTIRGVAGDFPEGGQNFRSHPGGILPPPNLILCEIYHLISSFCFQSQSYHTHKKQEISKASAHDIIQQGLQDSHAQRNLLHFAFNKKNMWIFFGPIKD